MQQQLIDSSQALYEAIDRLGCEYRVIGSQRHGRDILLVKVGGTSNSLRPVLVACGAHTDEQATIFASIELIKRIQTERPVYIIPCRDPLGFDGLRRCMQLEMGTDQELGDWEHLQETLSDNGEVLYHKDDLMIANLGEMAFAAYPSRENAATHFCENLWPKVIEEKPDVIERAKYRRFMLPADRLFFEEWDVFGPASATRYILETGKLRCPDTVIGTMPPPLPFAAQDIMAAIDEINPGMTLDLHEGGSDGYYMFADSPATDMEVKMAHAMSEGVAAGGNKVTPPQEIIDYWIEHFGESVPKLYTHIGASAWAGNWKGRTLAGYARQYGNVMVTETGRGMPLCERVKAQVNAVLGAIKAYDEG